MNFRYCFASEFSVFFQEPVLAAGLITGKVALVSFSPPAVVKEFVPRTARSCNAVSWNPHHSNQLAVGLDKVRIDYSTLVWDVTRSGVKTPSSSGASEVESITRPLSELANSEATVALQWVPSQPNCLAAGTGAKWVRIYDLRGDVTMPRSVVAHSKAVYGVTFDPFCDYRFATFSDSPDGVVKIWDLRMLTDPVFSLNTNSKSLLQICWSPTRPGVLATVSRDELQIKLWDMKVYRFLHQSKKKG
jgi:WD40 repeat protein